MDTPGVARRVSVPELIGRRAELAVLEAALAGAAEGGQLVLVQGDAGVGKTRLLQAFAQRARSAGATVLTGGCLQFEADIPYAPFVEALRAMPHAPPLLGDGAAAAGDRAGEFRRVADAITAAGGPVLLVLEDLHWADASTRDLVLYLHRALAGAPVLLVGTLRADEIGADHPVAKLVADLARSPRTERVSLAPLDRAEVVSLARAILGSTPPSDMVDALMTRAEGNPFFTEELLAAWPTRGEVPGTVREVVITRLARLSTAAQQLARLASVVGRTVRHDLLAGVAAMPVSELDLALRELVDHGQLITVEPDAYAFRHALIQESLYRDLLPGERRHAHARIAAGLRDRPELAVTVSAAGVAAELAHHWDAAGEPTEALAASVLAARAADDGLAPAEAHAHYERAVRRWPEVADAAAVTGIDHDELLDRAAEAASLAGHNHRAVELTRQRLAAIDESAEPERAALAYERLSYQARSAGDWELARRTSERAVELVPAGSAARLRIASWPMALDMLSGRYRDSVRRAEELLPQAESVDEMATSRGLMALGIGHVMLGHADTGLSYLRRQHEFAHRTGNPRFIGVGYVNLPEGLMWTDRHAEALRLAQEGVERSRSLGFDIYLLPIVGNVNRALVELHRWDEALDSAGDPDDPAFDPFNWIFIDLPRAEVLIKRGELDHAEELLKRTGAVLDGQDDVQYGTELAALRAMLAGQQRRWADARSLVRDGLSLAFTGEDIYLAARLVALGVRLEADALDDARASGAPIDAPAIAAVADTLLADCDRYRSTLEADGAVPLPRTLRMLALARAEHTRLGEPDPDAWSAVAGLATVDRHLSGYARFREAEALLLGRGSRTHATEALSEASTIATSLRADPLATMIHTLADRARLSLEAPATPVPSTSDGLTSREAEVLQLIGRGLTNAEIATELFISTKTASVHVSNILRKLGLKSRIQAAAYAQRRGAQPWT